MKKFISSGFFGLALVTFCLPWMTVSCQQQKLTSFTGLQMVTGSEVADPSSSMFGGPVKTRRVDPNPLAVVAAVAAVAAFVVSFVGRGAAVPAIIGVLVAFALKANVDQDVLKQGEGLMSVSYEPGFWGYILSLITGSVFCFIPGEAGSAAGDVAPARGNTAASIDEKQCPRCAETIKAEARVCKHCRHEFDLTGGVT